MGASNTTPSAHFQEVSRVGRDSFTGIDRAAVSLQSACWEAACSASPCSQCNTGHCKVKVGMPTCHHLAVWPSACTSSVVWSGCTRLGPCRELADSMLMQLYHVVDADFNTG